MNKPNEPPMSLEDAIKIIKAKIEQNYREAAARAEQKEALPGTKKPLKTCSKCGEEKPRGEFHKRKASKDGLSPRCKRCKCVEYRERYHSDPEFRERRIEYADQMYFRKHQSHRYFKWLVEAIKINREAVARGDKPAFNGMGRIGKDISAA